ncbi:ABC transporter B family member 26, chloroplastic-like isoform X2 [Mangifera indica]|uniref:ABC transporter B family member 26, chloroplastic-like isoform X2 n=1 Tax=Mangifera indica TaxID=29780 RepID=UPI001CFAD15A|nr:ABC transporter B family member 26, chloroplastic-like isoform X2 [Mangifera indica]
MATAHLNLHAINKLPAIFSPQGHRFGNKHQFPTAFTRNKQRQLFKISNSAFVDRFSSKVKDKNVKEFLEFLKNGWNLNDAEQVERETAKPITVWIALSRMWTLIGNEHWLLYVAFIALIVAAVCYFFFCFSSYLFALTNFRIVCFKTRLLIWSKYIMLQVSEISMPSILAASIFSAQRGETIVFLRSSRFLFMLCLTSGLCSGLRSGCFGIANMILVKRLRESLYSALVFQDILFFNTEAVGCLTSRLGADCQKLSNVIGNDVNLILRNSLQGIGALINLLVLSWPLALSALVICSVLSAVFLVYGQYQKKAAKLNQEFNACAHEVAQETLSMMRTVRVYGTEHKELGRYKQWLDKLASIGVYESMAYGLWNMSFITFYRSMQLLTYVLYCEWLIYATWRVVDNLTSLLQSIGASEKVFQLVDLLPSNQFLSKGVRLQKIMGHIQFVNVSFHYPSRATVPVLDNACLTIEANEVVAIVGLSGSGKSTFVNLLLRLYEPISGQILIDGFPLKELDIRWLREKIGFVGQEPHLFHMDIKSNIMYGCPRDIKHEDIEWAAEQAYAHEFILSLPQGYETLVDDALLSGGQKQRIAIARAILRDPAILILDEATSALDSESEHYVKGVLRRFRNDNETKRTIIVIAHRLSTIKDVDRVVVIDGG